MRPIVPATINALQNTVGLVKDPIFVVGCPRSGTTLLQSILGNHPEVCAFPESRALFLLAADIKRRAFGPEARHRHVLKQRSLGALNQSGWTAGRWRRFRREMRLFLDQLGATEQSEKLPRRMPTMAAAFAAFDTALSELASGRSWLEKSPLNLFIVDYINRYLPRARVIHVIRNGPDNIASLRDAGLRYRDFEGFYGGLDGARNALAQWNEALRFSFQWRDHERHYHLRHEDLCAFPEAIAREVCSFLGLPFEPTILQYDSRKLSWSYEVWKQRPSAAIQAQPSRFHSALSADEQAFVLCQALDAERYFPRRFGQAPAG